MNNIFKKGLSLVAFAFVFVLLGIANVSASDIYVKTTGGSTETIDVDLDKYYWFIKTNYCNIT